MWCTWGAPLPPKVRKKGAATSGRHLVGEHKCYTPLVPSTLGTGSRGGLAKVGDHVAFGNTEEALIVQVLGLTERGLESEGPFRRDTGTGHVPEIRGHYFDAIHTKGNTVLLLISTQITAPRPIWLASGTDGATASKKLVTVRGKDFRHEKNKRKRSYNGFARNGGGIDLGVRSSKFE